MTEWHNIDKDPGVGWQGLAWPNEINVFVAEPGDNRTSNEAHVQSDPMSPRSIALTDIHDLIHLTGPLTEDAVLKCLQARFGVSQFFVCTPDIV